MSEDYDNSNDTDSFATVVTDGAMVHFLEGFVSLLFYQDRVYPKQKNDGSFSMPKKRETIADVRLSINNLKKLMADVQDGIKSYPVLSLISGTNDVDFFTGLKNSQKTKDDEELVDADFDDEETERIKANSIIQTMEELTDEGKEKYTNEVVEILLENYDRLREIARKYNKKEPKHEKPESSKM